MSYYNNELINGNVRRCLDCGEIYIEKESTSCLSCGSINISSDVDESDDDYRDFLHKQELQDMD